MKRDLYIAIVVAVLLHVAFFVGGAFLKTSPEPSPNVARDEPISVIELVPLPQDEPAAANTSASSAAVELQAEVTAPKPTSTLEPLLAVADSDFVQPVQPPPPGLSARVGGIIIPGQIGGLSGTGAGAGVGQGLGNIFNLADLDQPPAAQLRVSPIYPYEMRRAGISGEVLVGFIVDVAGHVRDAYVVRASRREFADEAVRAVLRWKFTPGRRSGVPVNSRMQVPLVFKLESN